MTVTVKDKTDLVVPQSVRRQAGIKAGDQLEFKVARGVITIITKPAVTAEDEYTPEQRRIIDARLAKADEEIKKGRTFGPFNTADEMIASMKHELKKRAVTKKPKRS